MGEVLFRLKSMQKCNCCAAIPEVYIYLSISSLWPNVSCLQYLFTIEKSHSSDTRHYRSLGASSSTSTTSHDIPAIKQFVTT